MRTPEEDREKIRTELVVLRVSTLEKEEIKKIADMNGLPISSYIRMLVKQDIEKNK